MTLVKEHYQLTPGVRVLSPEEADLLEAQRLMEEAGVRRQEEWEKQKKTPVDCLSCGKTAIYSHQAGWMQGVHHIFTCPDGHESKYKLIAGSFIPQRETKEGH